MKLYAEDVVAFENRRVGHGVGARRRGRLVGRRVVAVREVEIRPLAHAVERARRLALLQLIPSHVRYARIGRESRDRFRKQTQARQVRLLFARLKQSLQPKTDTEEGNSGR